MNKLLQQINDEKKYLNYSNTYKMTTPVHTSPSEHLYCLKCTKQKTDMV